MDWNMVVLEYQPHTILNSYDSPQTEKYCRGPKGSEYSWWSVILEFLWITMGSCPWAEY